MLSATGMTTLLVHSFCPPPVITWIQRNVVCLIQVPLWIPIFILKNISIMTTGIPLQITAYLMTLCQARLLAQTNLENTFQLFQSNRILSTLVP